MKQLFACIAAVVLFAGTAFAQDEPEGASNSVNPFGFEFAQFIAERSPMEMTSIQQALLAPKDSVLVLLGDIPLRLQNNIPDFIDAGGAAVVGSDLDASCDLFRLRAGPLLVRDDEARYRGYDDCFAVTPKEHELTEGVREIVFNRSGYIRYRWSRRKIGKWSDLAVVPNRNTPLLSVYEQRAGRLVVMADHSPFTNQMLTHGDNAILLVNTINWLKGNRRKVAFIVDGNFQADSGLPPILPEDEIPPIDPNDLPKDTMLAIANRFLREAQNDNAFNRLLTAIPPWRIRQVLIVLTTVLLGFIVFRRLTKARTIVKPPETNASNASEARAASMLRRKTLYPAAAELARGFVRELTGMKATTVTPEIDKRHVWVAPDVPGSTSRVCTDVAKIARLAGGLDQPKRLKPKQLRKLAERIDELTAMFRAGQLRLQSQAATT